MVFIEVLKLLFCFVLSRPVGPMGPMEPMGPLGPIWPIGPWVPWGPLGARTRHLHGASTTLAETRPGAPQAGIKGQLNNHTNTYELWQALVQWLGELSLYLLRIVS